MRRHRPPPIDDPVGQPETPPLLRVNDTRDRGALAEHVARVAIQAEYPDYREAPAKPDGMTGPDQVWLPARPTDPVLVVEVKLRANGERVSNPARLLDDTRSGRQLSKEYVGAWIDRTLGRKR